MRNNVKKNLKLLKQWPVLILFIWLVMAIVSFIVDKKAGFIVSAFWMAYLLVLMILFVYDKTILFNCFEGIGAQFGFLHNALLTELNVPYAVLMEDGKIAEMGNHDELMELNGRYAKMYQTQSGHI